MRVKQASYGCKISSACGHSPPFSQALTAALHVIVSIWMLLPAMTRVTLTSDMLQFPTVTLTTRITEGCVGPAAAPDSNTHACRMWRLIGAVSKVSSMQNITTASTSMDYRRSRRTSYTVRQRRFEKQGRESDTQVSHYCKMLLIGKK